MPSRRGAGSVWRPYVLAWVVVVLGFALTAGLAWRLSEQARELDQARFQRLVRQNTQALRDRFDRYEAALQALADFVAMRPHLTPAEWRFRIRLLWPEEKYPGLLEIGFAQSTASGLQADNSGLETSAAATVRSQTPLLQLAHCWVRPPSAADGIGDSFLEDAAVAEAARQAMQTDQATLLYGREFSAEIGGNPASGFVVFVPVRDPESTSTRAAPTNFSSEEEARQWRESHTRGVVFGCIQPVMFLENLFGTAPREVDFDLFHGVGPSPTNWLNIRRGGPKTLLAGFSPYLHTSSVLPLSSGEWSATFYTTPLFERESSRDRPRIALAVGGLLTSLVAALMVTQIRARLRLEDIAAELRSACEDLQRVQNERERISRDLHDGAIQSLYGLQLSLGHYEHQLSRDPPAARDTLHRCRLAVDALIAELRTFLVQHLPGEESPELATPAGAALQQLVHRFQSASSVPIELVLKDSPATALPLGQQIHLRQVAQEAISNSLRHARPRHIRVVLERHNQHLRLAVADDGVGFDTARSYAGQGLANLQARAMQLGGQLRVQSQPGQGTQILLEVPIKSANPQAHG